MGQTLERQGSEYPVDPSIAFRGPKEPWAEWTPAEATSSATGG